MNEVLKSKRFISGIVGLFLMLVIPFVPELQKNEDQLNNNITYVVLMLVGGYSLQEVVRDWKNDSKKRDDLADIVQSGMDAVERAAGGDVIPDPIEEGIKATIRRSPKVNSPTE